MNAGAGADRVPGPFINTLPVRVRVSAAGGRRGGRDAGAAGRAAGPRARAADAGAAGQRGDRAGPAVHLAAQLPAQPGAGAWCRRLAWMASRCWIVRERTNYPVTVSVDDDGYRVRGHGAGGRRRPTRCRAMRAAGDGGGGPGRARWKTAPGMPLRRVSVLAEAERRQLVAGWNDTAAPVPGVTVAELLVRQRAARSPDAVAVVCGAGADDLRGSWTRRRPGWRGVLAGRGRVRSGGGGVPGPGRRSW